HPDPPPQAGEGDLRPLIAGESPFSVYAGDSPFPLSAGDPRHFLFAGSRTSHCPRASAPPPVHGGRLGGGRQRVAPPASRCACPRPPCPTRPGPLSCRGRPPPPPRPGRRPPPPSGGGAWGGGDNALRPRHRDAHALPCICPANGKGTEAQWPHARATRPRAY